MSRPESFMALEIITAGDNDCSLKTQYNTEDQALYSLADLPLLINSAPFEKYYNNSLKMTQIQRQFFPEPTDSQQMRFVYCPGKILGSFYFPKDKKIESLYSTLAKEDKLYILKWVFAALCSVKILIANQITPINLFSFSLLIDSNMEARYFYSYWDNKIPTLTLDSNYYKPPESRNATVDKNIEKENIYSIGLLLLSLLNRRNPSVYFQNFSQEEKDKKHSEGTIFLSNIPKDCKLKKIIENSLKKNPNDRPTIMNFIQFLLDEDNCLEGVDYKKFKKYVTDKFQVDEKIDKKELIQKIEMELTKSTENSKPIVRYQKFSFKNLQYFIKLAQSTSSYGDVIAESCNETLKFVWNCLKDNLKKFYSKYSDKSDKYELMRYCLANNNDDFVDSWSNYHLNLFTVDDMISNDFLDTSLTVRIYTKRQSIKFVLPKKLQIDDNPALINNDLFVKVNHEIESKSDQEINSKSYKEIDSKNSQKIESKNSQEIDSKSSKEIDFFPFLNVYNILYNSACFINIQTTQKANWLCQTAEALKILNDAHYTIPNFTSKNVFVDSNFNARLFPFKLTKLENAKFISEPFFEMSDFCLSYIPPELLVTVNDSQDVIDMTSYSEKSIVYSFGVFGRELIFNERPDFFLQNCDGFQKVELLKKNRKLPSNMVAENRLMSIIDACLEKNPNNRKSIDQVFKSLTEYIQMVGIKILAKEPKNNIDTLNDLNKSYNELEQANDIQKVDGSEKVDSSEKVEDYLKFGNNQFDVIQEALDNGSSVSARICDHLYSLLNFDKKITYNGYLESYPTKCNKFKLICSLLNDEPIIVDKIMIKNEANHSIYDDKFELKTKTKKFECETFASDYMNKIERKQWVVCNKPSPKFCYLSGLREPSMRQVLIRTGKNLDYHYRQQIEFCVKNKYLLPYGNEYKMKEVDKILDEMSDQMFFLNKPKRSKSSKGNGNTILDMEIP